MQTALDAAAATTSTADRVLIGSGVYTRTGGFTYIDGNSVNAVDIIGVGSPLPQLTMTSNASFQAVLTVLNSASTVTNLAIDVPGAASNPTGLQTGGGVVSDHIVVTGPSTPSSRQTGIGTNGAGATVKDCVVAVSATYATGLYILASGQTVIRDNTVTADRALDLAVANGSTARVRRNRLSASSDGILMYYGDVDLDNTLIDLRGGSGVGVYMDTVNLAGELSNTIDASELTIRNGGASSVGVRQAGGAGNADPNAIQTMNMTDSIIWDVGHPFDQQTPAAGALYTVNTDYSDYNAGLNLPASPSGQIQRIEQHHLDAVDPHFRDPISGTNGIGGDYRLAFDSPLIDAGSSTSLGTGETDIRGLPRIVAGVAPYSTAVRDLGAYEYQHAAPAAAISATPNPGITGRAINFDGSGSSDLDGDALIYAWTFDDGAGASGATVAHAFGTTGTHSATLTVTDATGLLSTSSASVTVNAPVAAATGLQAAALKKCKKIKNKAKRRKCKKRAKRLPL